VLEVTSTSSPTVDLAPAKACGRSLGAIAETAFMTNNWRFIKCRSLQSM
jgi:hypothetical protein